MDGRVLSILDMLSFSVTTSQWFWHKVLNRDVREFELQTRFSSEDYDLQYALFYIIVMNNNDCNIHIYKLLEVELVLDIV